MPVMHDSEDWQNVVRDVATLKGDVRAIRSDLHAQTKVQDGRHADNRTRFKALEDEVKSVKTELADLKDVIIQAKGVLEGIKAAAHILKWLLGVAIALQTVYMLFGPSIRKAAHLPNARNDQQSPALSDNSRQNPQNAKDE